MKKNDLFIVGFIMTIAVIAFVMAILYLTEKNTDYNGGLHAIKNNIIFSFLLF